MKKFRIEYSGSTDLTVEEIWPDGDAPENPKPVDVVNLMRKTSKIQLLSSWNLDEDLDIHVVDVESKQITFAY